MIINNASETQRSGYAKYNDVAQQGRMLMLGTRSGGGVSLIANYWDAGKREGERERETGKQGTGNRLEGNDAAV